MAQGSHPAAAVQLYNKGAEHFRNGELDQAIEDETKRPLPDGLVVQMLKRQKLRIKDKLYRLSAA